jgi:outer membrane protein assembly factor BamB
MESPDPRQGHVQPDRLGRQDLFLTAIETDRTGEPPPSPRPIPTPRPPSTAAKPQERLQIRRGLPGPRHRKVVWQETAREEVPHEAHHPDHGYASYSPVTDGKLIWASFGSRGVHCYDLDGQHKWSRDLGRMRIKMAFGEGSSPALAGDALIVVMDQEDESFIYALNKDNGEILWKQHRDEDTAWATPAIAQVNGRLQAIVSATKLIRCYDVATGDLLWQCGGQTQNVIPSPIVSDGMVFCTSGFRGSELQAIELGHTGDLTGTAAVRWQVSKATPYVPSPILYGDNLYVCSMNKAAISCYHAQTGKLNFSQENLDGVKDIYASPVGAAGRVYFVGRKGTTQVITNSEKFEILATNVLDDEIDASPAVAGDQIFLKGKKNLYCIGLP